MLIYLLLLLSSVGLVCLIKHMAREGESPGVEETHVTKVVGSNPGTVYWMDIFTHIFVVKIVMMFI